MNMDCSSSLSALNMHSSQQPTSSNPLKRKLDYMMSCSSTIDMPPHMDAPVLVPAFTPRSYQKKIFDVALRQNTIAVLDTGSGKTMIAVLLINSISQVIKSDSQTKKLIIFMAPTVNLVHQQYDIIKNHTNLRVGHYYGDLKIDEWSITRWQTEIYDHDVMVMTPQILLDALRKAILSVDMVCLLIFDECHRATGNHPYTKIMKEFYHKSGSKPKVFGMTASPVIKKGFSSINECDKQIMELESILDSQIYTVQDREVQAYVPSAKEVCKFYDPPLFSYLELKEKLGSLWLEFDGELDKLQGSVPSHYRDLDDKVQAVRRRLSKDYRKILHCLDDLGLVCAYEAITVCVENRPCLEGCDLYKKCAATYKHFMEVSSCICRDSLPSGGDCGVFCFDYLNAVKMGYISPKLHKLLELFQSFGRDAHLSCLIFVDRIITALVVTRFMEKVTFLSHYMVSYLSGSNSSADALAPKVQKETLNLFRSGKINLLLTTDVVEEGIDVPNCSCVIRFDLPKAVRSYIQSRGRARQKDSQFVMMVERGNSNHREQLFDIIRSELSVAETAINRDPNVCVVQACSADETDGYLVNATGASITADSSVNLIHLYCAKLPCDQYFTPKPIFRILPSDGLYKCQLTFPPNSAFQTIVGPLSRNSHVSKQLVCLEACKRLHQLGALNDRLLPCIEVPEEFDLDARSQPSDSGAGTTKRKELHGTTPARSLSGNWIHKNNGLKFQAYKMEFSCNIVNQIYSSFVLLLESKVDNDVGNIDVDLFLLSKMVKASVRFCGEIVLNAEEVMKAKCFHELFFNGLFGKLFIGSESSISGRSFLLSNENRSLWSPSDMYLVLPVDPLWPESWRINWRVISSCTSVIEFMKEFSWLGYGHRNSNKGNSVLGKTNTMVADCIVPDVIYLANDSLSIDNLKEKVVLAIHTGRIYSVLDVVNDSSADSPFEGEFHKTFREYFNTKYGIVLIYPEQRLLKLKHSHNPHNLLVDFKGEGDSFSRSTSQAGKSLTEKPRFYAHMPPELLVVIDASTDVLKSFYLLPSLMHRLESLMLASQLREEIACHFCSVPSSLILEALTTLRCCESFSMERLELLGDSVLKYAVSCHLFIKYPDKHEGQLSSRRQWVICNSNLHKVGASRSVQGYIRDSAFDPLRWTAPGQLCIHPVPCSCEVDGLEVPLNRKFHTEDTTVKVSKTCDSGHRWMSSKTISDCVEALIGAYYVHGGLDAALFLMKWFGIIVDLDPLSVMEIIKTASLHTYDPKINVIESLESRIGYTFSIKGLLLEAITHASAQEMGINYCYQRLEFVGDSVLDLLITRHLYYTHVDIDPGELTDLRSASVNNESFAQAAVRQNLQQHLQHSSALLLSQIAEYVKSLSGDPDSKLSEIVKSPKALGDMIESIAGAILIDTELKIEEVWKIMKPLLSPIVTPDMLELHPLRRLNELCSHLGLFVKESCINQGEAVKIELKVQLEDVLLMSEGCGKSKKGSRAHAALLLLKDLKRRGISRGCSSSKRRNQVSGLAAISSASKFGCMENLQTNGEESYRHTPNKKPKTCESQSPTEPYKVPSITTNTSPTPVIAAIYMQKGGPRNSLYSLCKSEQWQMPSFETTEHKSRSPIVFEGPEKRTGFSSFVSKITLYIPNYGNIECIGDPRPDKKSSNDSAAMQLLYELERLGKLIIANTV